MKAKIFIISFVVVLATIFATAMMTGSIKDGLIVGCIAVAVVNALIWILTRQKAVRS